MPGWDEHLHRGHPNGDPFEMPADLAAVQADDALLDMIGAGHAPSDADDELTRVLAAWRLEVHTEPAKELVDTSTALALIRAAARRPARRRSPVFGSIAGAAAVVVIAFSSVGLVAKSAEPGDPLWGVTQVLYSEYAESVETAAAVRTDLQQANKALEQGDRQQAREALQRIREQLPAVGVSEGRTELTTAQQKLEEQLNPTSTTRSMDPPAPAGATLPGPAGVGPNVSESDQSKVPASEKTSTAPDSSRELPGKPGGSMDSDQFLPRDAGDPRSYYPYPGAADPPGPGRGAQDFRPPGETGRPGDDPRTSPGDPTSGGTGSGSPSPSPRPAPPPAPPPAPSAVPTPGPGPGNGSSVGLGSSTGQASTGQASTGVSAPQSSRNDVPLVSIPRPDQPTVAEADQPSFSANTASV